MNINSTYSSAAFGLLFFLASVKAEAFEPKQLFFNLSKPDMALHTPNQMIAGKQGLELFLDYEHLREKTGQEHHQYWIEESQSAAVRKRSELSDLQLGFYGQLLSEKNDIRHKDKDWQVALPQATQQSHNYALSVGIGPFLIVTSQYKNQETLSLGVDSREGLQLAFVTGERDFNTDLTGNLKGRDFILQDHRRFAVTGIELNLQRESFDAYLLSLKDKNDLYNIKSLKVSSDDYFAEYSYHGMYSPLYTSTFRADGDIIGFSEIYHVQESFRLGKRFKETFEIAIGGTEIVVDDFVFAGELVDVERDFCARYAGNVKNSGTIKSFYVDLQWYWFIKDLNIDPLIRVGQTTITDRFENVSFCQSAVAHSEVSTESIPYEKLDFLSLSLPIKWQSGALTLEYRMQQLIPLSIKYREGYGGRSGSGSGSGSPDFSRLPDMNMQALSIHYNF